MTTRNSVFCGGTAVITGAGSGIGRAIALELAERGAAIHLIGRRAEPLITLAREIGRDAAPFPADVTNPEDLQRLAGAMGAIGRLDLLVHCAATYLRGDVTTIPQEEFEMVLRTNVVAPYALTRLLFPQLVAAQGAVVFMNSTAGLNASAGMSAYSVSKHALKALADCLRSELNPHGVRALSVFPGRTDTPLQQDIHYLENRTYNPEKLVPAPDIARATLDLLDLSRSTEVTDVTIRPNRKL